MSRWSLRTAIRAAGLERDFNPDQPRDDSGRFATSGGSGGSGGASAGPRASTGDGKPYTTITRSQHLYDYSAKLRDSSQKEWDSLKDDEKLAVWNYSDNGFKDVNKFIGRASGDVGAVTDPEIQKEIKALTAALNKGSLPENTVLFKGAKSVNLGLPDGGPEKIAEQMIGKVITDHAFGSTSISPMTAEAFSEGRGVPSVTMRVKASAGSKGMWLGDTERSANSSEYEFLIQRGARYMVTGHGEQEYTAGGAVQKIPVLDVVLLPHDEPEKG